MRPGVTSMMRALPNCSSVITPACEPVNDCASSPRLAIAMARTAMEMRSPAVRSMSSSRAGGHRRNLLGQVDEIVGAVSHGRHHDNYFVTGLTVFENSLGHPLHRFRIGYRGPAKLLDDYAHCSLFLIADKFRAGRSIPWFQTWWSRACFDQDFSRVGSPAPRPLYEVSHFTSPSPVIQTLLRDAVFAATVRRDPRAVHDLEYSSDDVICLSQTTRCARLGRGDVLISVGADIDGEQVPGLAVQNLAQCDEC